MSLGPDAGSVCRVNGAVLITMTPDQTAAVYDRIADPDALLQEVESLLRRRAEARDRLIAQQTLLPIPAAAPGTTRARRRR